MKKFLKKLLCLHNWKRDIDWRINGFKYEEKYICLNCGKVKYFHNIPISFKG